MNDYQLEAQKKRAAEVMEREYAVTKAHSEQAARRNEAEMDAKNPQLLKAKYESEQKAEKERIASALARQAARLEAEAAARKVLSDRAIANAKVQVAQPPAPTETTYLKTPEHGVCKVCGQDNVFTEAAFHVLDFDMESLCIIDEVRALRAGISRDRIAIAKEQTKARAVIAAAEAAAVPKKPAELRGWCPKLT